MPDLGVYLVRRNTECYPIAYGRTSLNTILGVAEKWTVKTVLNKYADDIRLGLVKPGEDQPFGSWNGIRGLEPGLWICDQRGRIWAVTDLHRPDLTSAELFELGGLLHEAYCEVTRDTSRNAR